MRETVREHFTTGAIAAWAITSWTITAMCFLFFSRLASWMWSNDPEASSIKSQAVTMGYAEYVVDPSNNGAPHWQWKVRP